MRAESLATLLLQRFRNQRNFADARIEVLHEAGPWIAPPRATGFWTPEEISGERAPLPTYAAGIAVAHSRRRLPADDLLRLMGVANYYGDSDLVVDLHAMRQWRGRQASSALKHLAKAHKNAGRFGLARDNYRAAILKAGRDRDPVRLAYNLMLFAKLCHDYQQRQGWHREYHRIAHARFAALRSTHHVPEQWDRIATDALAKAIYDQTPGEAHAAFQRLMSARLPADTRIRVQSHFQQARFAKCMASADLSQWDTIVQVLEDFRAVVADAHASGNVRAWHVRRAQLVRMARQAETWRRRQGGSLLPSVFLDGLLAGEADYLARAAAAGAQQFSDRKTEALALLEHASWSSLREPAARELVVDRLQSARAVLESMETPIAALYHEVLIDLGHASSAVGDWNAAIESFDTAYRFSLSLKQSVDADETTLTAPGSAPLTPELLVLSPVERHQLLDGFRLDYRLLLDRVAEAGEELRRAQRQERLRISDLSARLIPGFKYHHLAERLRKLKEVRRRDEVRREVDHLEKMLTVWRAEDDKVNPPRVVPLQRFLAGVVDDLRTFSPDGCHVSSSDGLPLEVAGLFNEMIGAMIIRTLFINVLEVAQRGSRSSYGVHFAVDLRDGVAWLRVEDDVGEFDDYRRVIEALNAGQPPPSSRHPDPGAGLMYVRDCLFRLHGLSQPWELEAPQDRKCLSLPFAKLVAERT